MFATHENNLSVVRGTPHTTGYLSLASQEYCNYQLLCNQSCVWGYC
jgi:hypothetical protein